MRSVAMTFLVMSFASCVKNPADFAPASGDKLQILYTIPDQVPGSYATVGAHPLERLFDEAYVLFYDASGAYVAHAPSNQSADSQVGSFEVVKPAEIELGKQYKLLVVANMKYYLDKTKYATTNDYINAKTALQYETMRFEISATSTNRISGHLPMYAHQDVTIAEPMVVSVKFERSVARFDLVSLAQDLDIEWVKVCNYNNAGYFYHNDHNVIGSSIINGAGGNDLESSPHKVFLTRRAGFVNKADPQSNTNGGLYAFPNINLSTGINDQKTTCLLFKGTYSYTEGGVLKTKEGYYRVNICMPGKSQNLKRNNIYRITVKSVTDGGSGTEDEGIKNPIANVNYEINDWTVDNSQEIITDDKGNYLAVSPVSAYIGGGIGSSLTGTIKVKNSSFWEIEKLDPAADWFSVAKTTDGKGFILTALKENASPNFRSSKVRVKVVGTTLQYDIFVYQHSTTVSKDVLLMIDGRMGDFSMDVDGNGLTYKLQVLLGNGNASATMTWVSGATDMIRNSNPPIGSPGIGNNTTLNLVFNANSSGKKRTSIYKIVRRDSANPDLVSQITFNQEPTTEIIVASPAQLFDKEVCDGFMNLKGAANALVCQYQRVTVRIRDVINYPKWKLTSTFDPYDVTFVLNPSKPTISYPTSGATTIIGLNNDTFDVAVARCGPGDAPLSGTITIAACSISGVLIPGGPTYTYTLTVRSSLNSGFTQMGNVLYHDRNLGAPDNALTDEITMTPSLPFSNHTGDYQSKYPRYDNFLFKGSYLKFKDAQVGNQCPLGWRLPTKDEYTSLIPLMQWAKAGGRPYIVASTGDNKDTKGCYFPMSGDGINPNGIFGNYWSSTPTAQSGYGLIIYPASVSVQDGVYENGLYSVRCVKDVI